LILEEMVLAFPPFSMMLAIDLSCIAFIMLRNVPSIPLFVHSIQSFYNKRTLNLCKAFSAFVDMMMWFLSLTLFMCCIMFIDLYMLYHLCTPGTKPHCSLLFVLKNVQPCMSTSQKPPS
jgi:lipoprotein signal peptidase